MFANYYSSLIGERYGVKSNEKFLDTEVLVKEESFFVKKESLFVDIRVGLDTKVYRF